MVKVERQELQGLPRVGGAVQWAAPPTPATKEKTGYEGCEGCVRFSAQLVRLYR